MDVVQSSLVLALPVSMVVPPRSGGILERDVNNEIPFGGLYGAER